MGEAVGVMHGCVRWSDDAGRWGRQWGLQWGHAGVRMMQKGQGGVHRYADGGTRGREVKESLQRKDIEDLLLCYYTSSCTCKCIC